MRKNLTYNKNDVIITLLSKSKDVVELHRDMCPHISFFVFKNKEKAGVRLPQRLFFVCVLVFIVIIAKQQ